MFYRPGKRGRKEWSLWESWVETVIEKLSPTGKIPSFSADNMLIHTKKENNKRTGNEYVLDMRLALWISTLSCPSNKGFRKTLFFSLVRNT